MPDEQSERTKGLDIEDWYYPDTKKLFRAQRTPVHFIAWDLAGEVGVRETLTKNGFVLHVYT